MSHLRKVRITMTASEEFTCQACGMCDVTSWAVSMEDPQALGFVEQVKRDPEQNKIPDCKSGKNEFCHGYYEVYEMERNG